MIIRFSSFKEFQRSSTLNRLPNCACNIFADFEVFALYYRLFMESASRRTLPGPLLHIIVLLAYYYIGYFKSHVVSIVVVMDQIASNFSAMIFIYGAKQM